MKIDGKLVICVQIWSKTGYHGKTVATDFNQFFIGLMMFLKPGKMATGPKETGP
jgi:hypothetical protein